jgi:hypothetical protein
VPKSVGSNLSFTSNWFEQGSRSSHGELVKETEIVDNGRKPKAERVKSFFLLLTFFTHPVV